MVKFVKNLCYVGSFSGSRLAIKVAIKIFYSRFAIDDGFHSASFPRDVSHEVFLLSHSSSATLTWSAPPVQQLLALQIYQWDSEYFVHDPISIGRTKNLNLFQAHYRPHPVLEELEGFHLFPLLFLFLNKSEIQTSLRVQKCATLQF